MGFSSFICIKCFGQVCGDAHHCLIEVCVCVFVLISPVLLLGTCICMRTNGLGGHCSCRDLVTFDANHVYLPCIKWCQDPDIDGDACAAEKEAP